MKPKNLKPKAPGRGRKTLTMKEALQAGPINSMFYAQGGDDGFNDAVLRSAIDLSRHVEDLAGWYGDLNEDRQALARATKYPAKAILGALVNATKDGTIGKLAECFAKVYALGLNKGDAFPVLGHIRHAYSDAFFEVGSASPPTRLVWEKLKAMPGCGRVSMDQTDNLLRSLGFPMRKRGRPKSGIKGTSGRI